MMDEPVNAKIFFSGLATKKTAVKSIAFGIWIAFFVLAGFTIYKAFFVKTSQQQIIAKPGSNVQVTQINKTSRFFIPFVEIYTEHRSGNDGLGYGVRAGVRLEL